MATIFSQILIIHEPGRKRANLAVLLGSIFHTEVIQIEETLKEGLEYLSTEEFLLVIISDRFPMEEIEQFLKESRKTNPHARVLLMLPHPQENSPYLEMRADGILYDGFTTRSLVEMLGRLL